MAQFYGVNEGPIWEFQEEPSALWAGGSVLYPIKRREHKMFYISVTEITCPIPLPYFLGLCLTPISLKSPGYSLLFVNLVPGHHLHRTTLLTARPARVRATSSSSASEFEPSFFSTSPTSITSSTASVSSA
ncbi:FAD-linked oxidoreductase patO, partial [Fusarium oxysporum f. sp. albedinis]